MISRFGQKETVNLWSGLELDTHYYMVPGFMLENLGKRENLIEGTCVSYVWTNGAHKIKKHKESYYHGAAPLVYAAAILPEASVKSGTLVFLPRSDGSTDINFNDTIPDKLKALEDNFEGPLYFNAYASDIEFWKNYIDESKLLFFNESARVSDWQFLLYERLNRFKNILVPVPSSNVFYGVLAGCNVFFFNMDEVYSESHRSNNFLPSYAPSNQLPVYYEFLEYLSGVFNKDKITEQQIAVANYFLSLDKIQEPEEVKAGILKIENYLAYKRNTIKGVISYQYNKEGREGTLEIMDRFTVTENSVKKALWFKNYFDYDLDQKSIELFNRI